jgi:hypothetical protein
LVLYKSSVAIKNGKRLGKTELDQRSKPFFADSKLEEEKRIKHIAKNENKIVKKFFFKEIIISFMVPLLN